MGLNIREAIATVLQKYGHDIVYVERDLRFRCSCYSERSRESADPNCPKCLGTSYHVLIKKLRVRRNLTTVPETLVGVNKLTQAGDVTPKAYTYYMTYDASPKNGDMILEVDWKQGIPVKVKEKLFISVVEPKFGEEGQIEFYQVYCRYQPKGVNDNDALFSN
jgi:hypothetical protein